MNDQGTLLPKEDLGGEMAPAAFDMQALFRDAIAKGPDGVEVLERLMVIDREVKAESKLKAFNAAMRRFKHKCPKIRKNKDGAKLRGAGNKAAYRYADYEEIRDTIDEPLFAEGFTVSFDTEVLDGGKNFKTICYIEHEEGHVKNGSFTCPTETQGGMSGQQRYGGANTFGRRYALANALDLVISDDLDGADLKDMEPITPAQFEEIEKLFASVTTGVDDEKANRLWDRMLKWAKVEKMGNLPVSKLDEVKRRLHSFAGNQG